MMKIKKHIINFANYSWVGILATLLSIPFLWVLVDFIKIDAFVASTIVVVVIFFLKYYSYIKVRLIKSKFWIYLIINVLFSIAYIVLIGILIDLLRVPTLIAVIFVEGSLFILRYFAFYWVGLLVKE